MSRERGNSCGKQRYSYLKDGASSTAYTKQRHSSQEKLKNKNIILSKTKPMQSPLSQPVPLETRRVANLQKDIKISNFTTKQQESKNQQKVREDRIRKADDNIVTARLASPPRDMGCIRETDQSRISHESQFDPYKTGIFTSQALMSTPEKNTTFRKVVMSPVEEPQTKRIEQVEIVRHSKRQEQTKAVPENITIKIQAFRDQSMAVLYDFQKDLRVFGERLSKIVTGAVY